MKARGPHSQLSRLTGKLALAFGGLVVGLLLAELFVRLSDGAPHERRIGLGAADTVYQKSPNPILAYELKPNYRNDAPDLVLTCDRTNAHGLRDAERTIFKPKDVRRIILLGDSVVQSIDIRHTEDVVHHQLERLYTDSKTEVLNFGVTGYCTLSEVELLESKGLKFQPDIVVLIFVKNDFENFNMAALQLMAANRPMNLIEHLTVHSHLFRLCRASWRPLSCGTHEDPVKRNRQAIGDDNVTVGLTRLRKMADQNGFQPIVAVWPDFRDDGFADSVFMENRDELVIERLAATAHIPCVRMSNYFAANWKSNYAASNPRRDWTAGLDGMHLNEVGSRVAAECLYKLLADVQRLPPEYPASLTSQDSIDTAAVRLARSWGSDQDLAEGYRRAGILLMQRNQIHEGLESFEEALRIRPDFAEAHFNLGSALGRLGEYEQAVVQLQKALLLAPNHTEAHNNLGVALEELGRRNEAIAHYREAVRLDAKFFKARSNLGAALVGIGRISEATAQYRELLQLKPDDFDAHEQLQRLIDGPHQDTTP